MYFGEYSTCYDLVVSERHWPTTQEISEDISRWIAAGDEIMAIRMMMDGLNRLPYADATLLAQAMDEPRTTGDVRWDTLLAAALRYLAHRAGVATLPRWTVKAPLDRFWFPVRANPSKEYNDMAHTPAELMRVGIFMDERGFATA